MTNVCGSTSKSNGSSTSFASGNSVDAPSRSQPAKPLVEHSYSQETLLTFTRKVQPILFNGCGTGQCHANTKGNGFELQRPFANGSPPAQMTRQNLLHTLNLLDKEDPASSLLLRKARQQACETSRGRPPGKAKPKCFPPADRCCWTPDATDG